MLEEQMGLVTSTLWLPYQMLPDSAHPAPSNWDIGLSQELVVFQFATKFRPARFAFDHEGSRI